MTVFRTFTLTIEGPEKVVQELGVETSIVRHLLDGRMLRDAEDAINDQLPDDWNAKIREWDDE